MIQIIDQFYEAFARKDAESMVLLYHDEIVFEDPAFGVLHGNRAKNMWRMLCLNAQDLTIQHSDVQSMDDSTGSAHWEVKYTFRQTGRKVCNSIDAHFVFQDGKIIRHIDHFDLHKWARQAIGWKGYLLGGTSFFKKKLNTQTNRLLSKFESNLPG